MSLSRKSFPSIRCLLILAAALMSVPVGTGWAQNNMPDAPGKAETIRVCSGCHEVTRATSMHLDRAGWQNEMDKMISLGAKGTPEEFESILNYLSKNYPAEEVPKVRINSARQIELEAGLTLRRSQAAALVAYRAKHGPFHSIEDLKNVPGLDFAYIESKKDRITFE
jgi:competence protein ComEA